MKLLLWLSLFLVGLLGVVMPISYLYTASKLPSLESEFDLENLLRGYIEGERLGQHAGQTAPEKIHWPRPDFSRLPPELVSLYLSEMDCPLFFETPRETNLDASWRAFNLWAFNKVLPGTEAQCEFRLAGRIADEARIFGEGPHLIATLRIRNFLTKDQLVAYALEGYQFEDGVFGVNQAAQVLFHLDLSQLKLRALAELVLALPPNGFYTDIKQCRNPLLIRRARDVVLTHVAEVGLIPADRAKVAQGEDLACLQP